MSNLPIDKNLKKEGLGNFVPQSFSNLPQKHNFLIQLISVSVIVFTVVLFLLTDLGKNAERFVVKRHAVLEELDVKKPEIVRKNLGELTILSSDEKLAIEQGFYERDLEIAATASSILKKSEPYLNLYDSLWARYNVTKDGELLRQMRDIEDLIHREWPVLYDSLLKSEGFYKE